MTREEVKAQFIAAGITQAEWARRNGFSRIDVAMVLNGHRKCNYGKAHEIAVALGLKPTPTSQPGEKVAA